jgi:hypothetical protein
VKRLFIVLIIFFVGCSSYLTFNRDAMFYTFKDYDNNGILNTGDRIYLYYDRNKDGIPDEQVEHRLIITHETWPLKKLIDKNFDGFWDMYYQNFDKDGIPFDSSRVHIKIMKDEVEDLPL